MKSVTMTIKEFLNFRKEALKCNQVFICHILTGGNYHVEADAKFLMQLGF